MNKSSFEPVGFSGIHEGTPVAWGAVQSSVFMDYEDVHKTAKSTPSSIIESHVTTKVVDIERRLERLEETISNLQKGIDNLIQADEITIRDIPYNQAKREVAKYFKDHHGETIDAADIEEALCIEFTMAMTICEELENAGKIKVT